MLRILLKGLLYFVIVYYIFRLVDRALFGDRRAVENERKRREKEKEKLFKEYKKREGKVTIEHNNGQRKRFRKGEGEYVDYEEVK